MCPEVGTGGALLLQNVAAVSVKVEVQCALRWAQVGHMVIWSVPIVSITVEIQSPAVALKKSPKSWVLESKKIKTLLSNSLSKNVDENNF